MILDRVSFVGSDSTLSGDEKHVVSMSDCSVIIVDNVTYFIARRAPVFEVDLIEQFESVSTLIPSCVRYHRPTDW